ncbi:MAG: hypothetical protein WC787_02005 [Patescibacteria group bacterium]
MAFRLELPDMDDPYAMADWLEIVMFLTKLQQTSRAQLIDRMIAENGSTSQELEVPMGLLFQEIGRRRRIAGRAYPLEVDNTLIKIDPDSNSEFYKFLLLISLEKSPLRKGKRYKEIDEIFDKVVCAAAINYLGEGAKAIRFGSPPSDGRPTDFRKAVEWLSEKTGVPLGSGSFSPKNKDGGVDVVAWKPFADHKTGFILTLIQCTVQLNWFPKGKDIVDHVWLAKLDTGRPIITSLAIPFVIHKNYEKWDDLRRTVNVIFDRLRLAQVLAHCDYSAFTKMVRWNYKEMKKFSLS